ncbi:MAG: hypothetical protein GY941_22475 [Planctomycetes bacterium]|nr:hypothetical protein [Planctomycetota bacterium]
MSRTEFWMGEIKEQVFPDGTTLEEKVEWLNNNGYPAEVEDDHIYGIGYGQVKFTMVGDRVFIHTTLTEDEDMDIRQLTKTGKNTYNIAASFYNGGGGLSEVLEDLLEEER